MMRAAILGSGVGFVVACSGTASDADDGSSGATTGGTAASSSPTGGSTGTDGLSGTGDPDGTGAPDDTGAPVGPTYAEDVAPILAKHCWGCHVDGGFAPFPLVSYDDVATIGNAIVAETAGRRMPPWPIDSTGACQSFADARWLSDDELATIAAWVDAGSAPGDLAALPDPPTPPTLGEIDGTLVLPTYTPVAEPPEHPFDDYRCFVVDPGLTDGGTLVAFEVRPGVVEQAHHIVLFSLDSDAAVQQALANDAESEGPGYRCFGDAGVSDTRIVGAWTPGVPVVRFPEGTGVALPPASPIVVQMHYNLAGGAQADDTAIDLQVDPGATHLESVIFVDADLAIPPGVAGHEEQSVTTFDGGPVDLLAVFPHMHQIGRTMRVEITSGGATTCAADVPRYEFHWQELYSYTEGVRLAPGDEVRLRCGYDSTGRDAPTTWGEGSGDEMCAVVFFARPAQ